MRMAFIILVSLIACVAMNGNYVETNEPVPLPEKNDVRTGADAASMGTDLPDADLQKQEIRNLISEKKTKTMRKKHGIRQKRTIIKNPGN